MPLTKTQKDFICLLDHKGKQIFAEGGGDEALLMSMAHKMDDIKSILDASSRNELDEYCEQYTGFYLYMELLERLAQATADGRFDDLKKI